MPQSKRQNTILVPNPGQYGVNTQDSPITLPPGFATTANNCVIDKRGRIASRRGNEYVTTTGGTSSDIRQIFEAEWADSTTTVFSVGNNKIYTGTTTLTDVTGAATVTADAWQIAQLQDVVYFFQSGHDPLQYDKAVGALDEVSSHSGYTATVQQGTCCLSAFGRLWTAKESVVYWSDLLNGVDWGSGTAGSLDISTVLPQDEDDVVALSQHNNYLLIFTARSIIIYEGATSPSTMRKVDVVSGIGCAARDSIVSTGRDILFLDKSGYRSLGRTIQEKSNPIGSVGANVNQDIVDSLSTESELIKAHYSRTNKFVLLSFPSANKTYCFDTQFPLEDGAFRVTTWSGTEIQCQYELSDGTLYFGGTNGIREYSTLFTDDGSSYVMSILEPHRTYTQESVLYMGKELDIVVDGGNSNVVVLKWAYDWSDNYYNKSVTIPAAGIAEFGEAEFGVDEFGGSGGISSSHVEIKESGRNISIGMETSINGAELAVQAFNLHVITGRIY